MLRLITSFFVLVLLMPFIQSCSEETETIDIPDPPHYVEIPEDNHDGLLVDSPENHGVLFSDLQAAYKKAGSMPYLYSILIIKNGYLIAERYFNGAKYNHAKYTASVTKSFISALTGIAIEKGYFSLDSKMLDFFPEYITSGMDSKKFEITIRHLITMRAGYPYDSVDELWRAWVTSSNWVKYAIQQPLVKNPGQVWDYSSASSHILSAIITKAAGMSTKEFASEYLFNPARIKLGNWGRDPQGIYLGGWDIYMTPRNMAKFGLLYLNEGKIDSTQIIPVDWVNESTKPISTTGWDWGEFKGSRYGCLWWIAKVRNIDCYYAQGHGGQNILVIPSLDTVIVTTANADNSFGDGWVQSLNVAKFIADYIVNVIK
ncbi:MAG: serine hydrolase [bacterium]